MIIKNKMEYSKIQRKEDIDNRGVSVAKSKFVRFLVVGIVVLVLLSSSQVLAEEIILQGADCETAVKDAEEAKAICAAKYPGDDSAQFFCSVNLLAACKYSNDIEHAVVDSAVVEGTDQLPFEEYNSPPDISSGRQVNQNKKQIVHPICPGSVGNLTLDISNRQGEIRVTNNVHHLGCNYVETRYIAGHYQTYKRASFGLAWAEDNKVSEGIKKQLCSPDYIGWEEWSDNGKAASVTDVYLHDDLIGLKDELKSKIKVGLGNAEARALTCPGRTPVVKPQVMPIPDDTSCKERERLKNKYPGLAPGYVLFVEGMVNTPPFRTVIGYDTYGHSALYIGDYQVTKGNEFHVRDEAAAPLRVFRDGTQINLTLGKQTKEGDVIIGAVVEARGSGIIVTTVDKVEEVAREYFGRDPNFAWKTTYYPPTAEEIKKINAFALSKVKLTEAGGLEYFPGADGYGVLVENWDCVSFVEAAFKAAGKDLTPYCLDSDISIQPQEQHDYMDRDLTFWDLAMICIWVDSPVNLHLYDSQSRHVGITPNGAFEREIPNAYYDMELEEIPQSITIQDVDDEYTLVIEAVGDGSFDLKIRDLNVHTPGSLAKIEFQDIKITKGAMGKLNIGSADNDYLIDIDDDGDGDTDRTVEPSSLETSPITPPSTDILPPPTYPSTPPCTGTSNYAYIESRTMENEKEVRIPVMMCNANDLANMDFPVSYDPKVLRFKDAEKGSLNSNFLFESNEISSGNVKISFASSKGVSGSGSIAILTFDVVGSNGDSSILTGSVNTADTSSGSPIGLTINPGEFTVGPSAPGDCDGDGIVTSRDALAALQMSVGKIKTDLCYDVTGDGKVSSDDARDILKKAVKL